MTHLSYTACYPTTFHTVHMVLFNSRINPTPHNAPSAASVHISPFLNLFNDQIPHEAFLDSVYSGEEKPLCVLLMTYAEPLCTLLKLPTCRYASATQKSLRTEKPVLFLCLGECAR